MTDKTTVHVPALTLTSADSGISNKSQSSEGDFVVSSTITCSIKTNDIDHIVFASLDSHQANSLTLYLDARPYLFSTPAVALSSPHHTLSRANDDLASVAPVIAPSRTHALTT
jgi:hypothetical protein